MKKAAFIADESSCNYKIGCVGVIKGAGQEISSEALKDPLVKRRKGFIYVKSFNETLKGEKYCQECDPDGKKICIREVENLKGRDLQKVCTSHAEIGLIAKCAKYGIPTKGMVLFITNTPCYVCAKALIQAEIREIYYMVEHTDKSGLEILKTNGVTLKKLGESQVFKV